MKVVVVGGNGQLGCDICSVLVKDNTVIPLTHDDIEISDINSCKKIAGYSPDVVITTAAYHNVPKCEENPDQSFNVNTLGAYNVAKVCSEIDAVMVYFSTDYVFDGKKNQPYTELDMPAPLNMYGVTKVAGEQTVRYTSNKHFIVRVSGLYGEYKCRAKERNFPELMVWLYKQGKEIKVVNDEYLTPTYTCDAAKQLAELLVTEKYGTYHMTNNGSCSWYEFSVKLFELLDIDVQVTPVSASVFPSPVLRPGYSVLENANLKAIGFDSMRTWTEALSDYVSKTDLVNNT